MNYQNDNERSEMRLRSIWFSHSYSLRERLNRTRDWAAQEVALALPKRVRYWVTLQMIGKATRESENVGAATVDYILRHVDTPKDLA